MTERSSPLNQRLRRLLGTGSLNAAVAPPPSGDGRPRETETGMLFESQISRLSQALADLRAIDQQREAELCALREQVGLMRSNLRAAIAELDALIATVEVQAAPSSAATTLFERMRARSAALNLDADRRAELSEWLATLKHLRNQLRAMSDL